MRSYRYGFGSCKQEHPGVWRHLFQREKWASAKWTTKLANDPAQAGGWLGARSAVERVLTHPLTEAIWTLQNARVKHKMAKRSLHSVCFLYLVYNHGISNSGKACRSEFLVTLTLYYPTNLNHKYKRWSKPQSQNPRAFERCESDFASNFQYRSIFCYSKLKNLLYECW